MQRARKAVLLTYCFSGLKRVLEVVDLPHDPAEQVASVEVQVWGGVPRLRNFRTKKPYGMAFKGQDRFGSAAGDQRINAALSVDPEWSLRT